MISQTIQCNDLNWKEINSFPTDFFQKKAQKYLFETLELPRKYFEGSKKFYGQYQCQLNLSGGAQWFQPTYSIAFPLCHKITQEQMKQYTILYHGVKSNKSIKSILQNDLKPGSGQGYQNKTGKNPQKIVPRGIYSSQFLNTTLHYTDNTFPLVFQIAAKNQVITSRKDYIVVQEAILLQLICPFKNAPREQRQ